MKDRYWFSRTPSPSPQPQSKTKTLPFKDNSSKIYQTKLMSCKNECLHNAQQLLKLVQGFQQLSRLNEMHHNDFLQRGAIKQLKCLRHNSAIIVYCLSDNQLLCSVCAFAGNDHAKHMLNQAKGNMHHLELNVINSEKILKMKEGQIADAKRTWQRQIETIRRLQNQSLTELEREHDDILAALSSAYAKSKAKINEAFGQLQQNMKFIVSTLDRFADSLKCTHSLSAVKQLYFQEVVVKIQKANRMVPDPKIGEVMISSSKQIVKGIIKNFKNMASLIKK